MGAAITLPNPTIDRSEMIRTAAYVYVATYQTAGGDPPSTEIAYLGALEGPAEEDGGPVWSPIDGQEEIPGVIDHFLESDGYEWTFNLRQVNAKTLAMVLGGAATISGNAISAVSNLAIETGGPTNMQIALGVYNAVPAGAVSNQCPTKYQVLVSFGNEPQCAGNVGYSQLWSCVIQKTGSRSYQRKGIVTLPVKVTAEWDTSVTPAVTSGAAGANVATGPFGRRFVALA